MPSAYLHIEIVFVCGPFAEARFIEPIVMTLKPDFTSNLVQIRVNLLQVLERARSL